jgi:putative Mg2+ transporter-C (MgtC) family protein
MITDLAFMLKLVLAVALGAIVGFEREFDDEPAGVRTHILVILGSTLFTILSMDFFGTSDPSRVAANVVVGIGFIGAGAIFRAENKVKGITTAASLWVIAAIGMAVGLGFYIAATVTALMVFAVLFVKRFISKGRKNSGYVEKTAPANSS